MKQSKAKLIEIKELTFALIVGLFLVTFEELLDVLDWTLGPYQGYSKGIKLFVLAILICYYARHHRRAKELLYHDR